ncbi:hypothetical protein [Pantoea eucrina]|uniref:hypothetical protein n=1 Tax=Pantoea eucrina TaxID=472693 RepID=UPI00080F4DC4|nr:hypothetical protein [Pantoea eucrina]
MPLHEVLKLIHDSKQQNRTVSSVLFTTFTRSMKNASAMQRVKEYGICMHVLEELSGALTLT